MLFDCLIHHCHQLVNVLVCFFCLQRPVIIVDGEKVIALVEVFSTDSAVILESTKKYKEAPLRTIPCGIRPKYVVSFIM